MWGAVTGGEDRGGLRDGLRRVGGAAAKEQGLGSWGWGKGRGGLGLRVPAAGKQIMLQGPSLPLDPISPSCLFDRLQAELPMVPSLPKAPRPLSETLVIVTPPPPCIVPQLDSWRVPAGPAQVGDVVERIKASGGRQMNFRVQRDGTVIEVQQKGDRREASRKVHMRGCGWMHPLVRISTHHTRYTLAYIAPSTPQVPGTPDQQADGTAPALFPAPTPQSPLDVPHLCTPD